MLIWMEHYHVITVSPYSELQIICALQCVYNL
jgi:hypothetical protein